ncbi:unnamed protein product, partial [Rhizoctonia solani]
QSADASKLADDLRTFAKLNETLQQTHAEIIADRAQSVLECMSKFNPTVYSPHVAELIKALADEKHPRLVQCCTQALAAVVRTDNSLAPTEKRTTDRLVKIAQCDSPKQAKFALRALSYCKDGADLCAKVVKNIASTLPKAKGDTLVAHIAALAEAAKACPEAFEDKSNVITTYLDEMLTDDADEEWVEDNQLNAIGKAKLLALKVMHNRCLAHVNSDAALDVSQPVFKLLFAILEHGGAVNPSIDYDSRIKARLRLQAAVSLLKMSSAETYGNVVLKNLIMLAVTLQHFDMLFIRLLHLLAHHPDFTVTTEGLQDMAKYIEFYLDIVATAENISLQFHLALKAKTVRDADSHVFSEISKKEYLPEENLQWLSSAGKPIRSPTSKSRKTGDDKDKAPRKRKATASGRTNGTTKKARRPKKTNTWREQSADEESDEDLTSESDEDQDNVKTQHHANTTSTREERRLRRSRGGEELEPKQDSEQSGEEEGSGEEESGRESGRESDGETEEEVDQGGDKDKSVGVARKKRRMRGPRLTHRKRRASRPSKP